MIGKNHFTAASVRLAMVPFLDRYMAKLLVGQSPNWTCDQRTKDIFCLTQWLDEELSMRLCPSEDRIQQLWFFNRRCRAETDLYDAAAVTINNYLDGNIDKYRGR
jgi:hypothetical protein